MSKLEELRAACVVHPDFEFRAEDVARFEQLTAEEITALIGAREKLGHTLCTTRDESDKVHPDTVPI